MRKKLSCFVAVLAAVGFSLVARAQAPTIAIEKALPRAERGRPDQQPSRLDRHIQRLDRARAALDEAEAALARPSLSESELRQLRDRIEALPLDLQDTIDRLTPRLQAVGARLDELGASPSDDKPDAAPSRVAPVAPKPPPAPAPRVLSKPPMDGATPAAKTGKAKSLASPAPPAPAPEAAAPAADLDAAAAPSKSATADVSAEAAEQRKLYDETDATLKRARALLIEARQTLVTIIARQRALFAKTLFLRSRGLFSPAMWKEGLAEAPRAAGAAATFLEERAAITASRVKSANGAELSGVIALFALGVPLLLFLARRVLARPTDGPAPSPFKKSASAAWSALVIAAVPFIVILALNAVLDGFDLVDATLEPLVARLFDGVGRIAVTYALARALLAPGEPRWRLVGPEDPLAGRLSRLVVAVVAIMAGVRLCEQIEETVQAALSVAILTRGVGALACAALVAATPRGFPREGVGRANAGRDWLSLASLMGYAAVAAVLVACALGYITFANFFIVQSVWTLAVAGVLYIAVTLLRTGIERAFSPAGRLGRVAANALGVERRSLQPFAILLSGAMTLVCFGVAALLVLAPFGVELGDFLADLQSSFSALKIADVTISPSGAFSAVVLFAVTLAAAQGLRRWLDGSFLPSTRLDMGLRNSIGSSVGYAGFILAASVALARVGLGFEKLALIAGGLSLGVGLGLQSVVNNFVSGLILLWERAIRVGDWVVMGDDQGYVKRINVRSTEIETFDRATMIVPNSNLVTGVVKNWLRDNKVGRIKIALAPHSGVDPEKIRDIMLAAARAQEGVLRIPAPQVMFVGMEAAQFRFELWCFVEDVEQATRVRSDLHFDLHKRLADAGVNMAAAAAAPTIVQVRGLEKYAEPTADNDAKPAANVAGA